MNLDNVKFDFHQFIPNINKRIEILSDKNKQKLPLTNIQPNTINI